MLILFSEILQKLKNLKQKIEEFFALLKLTAKKLGCHLIYKKMTFFNQIKSELIGDSGKAGPESLEVLSPFYGKEHSEFFTEICLPSLIQSGLDKLCLKMSVKLSIYCPMTDWENIQSRVRKLVESHNLNFEWFELDSQPNSKNDIALFVKSRVSDSVNSNCAIIFAFPDLFFGRGIDQVVLNMRRGDYVVCGHPRVKSEESYLTFKRLIQENQYENFELVDSVMKNLAHSIVRVALREQHDYLSIEKKSDHYLCFFKEPPPLAIWGSQDIFNEGFKIPFWGKDSLLECIDHEIVNLMFKKNNLKIISDSRFFFWCELTPINKYSKMIKNNYWSVASSYLVKAPLKWHFSKSKCRI